MIIGDENNSSFPIIEQLSIINYQLSILNNHKSKTTLPNMLRVGLTGGIGSGKSTVARIFEILGIPVYYADTEAKRLMEADPALREAIMSLFGPEAYMDGTLNRPHIAAKMFADRSLTEAMNDLVHPATITDGEIWMKKQQSPYAIKEAALIFESGTQQFLDKVIGVSAPPTLRLHRAMKRDGSTREKVMARMAQQMDEDIKMKLCDFIIVNDEQHPLINQVLQLHETLLEISKKQS